VAARHCFRIHSWQIEELVEGVAHNTILDQSYVQDHVQLYRDVVERVIRPWESMPDNTVFVGHKALINHQHKPAAFTYLGILNPSVGIRELPPGYCSPGREPKNNRT
jgi:hypothetical protein